MYHLPKGEENSVPETAVNLTEVVQLIWADLIRDSVVSLRPVLGLFAHSSWAVAGLGNMPHSSLRGLALPGLSSPPPPLSCGWQTGAPWDANPIHCPFHYHVHVCNCWCGCLGCCFWQAKLDIEMEFVQHLDSKHLLYARNCARPRVPQSEEMVSTLTPPLSREATRQLSIENLLS